MKHLLIYMLVSITLFSHSYRELRDNVLSGGVPRDGIPPIEKPVYIDTQDAKSFMADDDIVFVWENNGATTIIPQKILVWHEIINDRDNGKNISITYCPLTASVTGYYSATSLGVSGKLLNSNLVMYDRASQSLWPQITGTSISPDTQGKQLDSFSLTWSTWSDSKNTYPNARVLSTDTGIIRNYNKDPYGNYSDSSSYYNRGGAFFPLMSSHDTLLPKTMVRGLISDSDSVAIPWDFIRDKKILNISKGDIVALVLYDERLKGVRAFSRIFEGNVLEFYLEGGKLKDRTFNKIWDYKGESGDFALEEYRGMDAFWFAWSAFYPETEVIDNE